LLQTPKFDFISNAKPSMFAYPAMTKPPETKEVEKVATAVLSTTARAAARAKKHHGKDAAGGDAMEVDAPASATSATAPTGNELTSPISGEEANKDDEDKKDEKKKKEPTFEILENLSRVVPMQLKYIKFREGSRYVPVKKVR
jgi:26S proteasome regulatory subunit N2